MSDLATIIQTLGGVTRISRELGVPLGTVSAWKTRGSIPVRNWPALVALAGKVGASGVTHVALVAAHQPAPQTQQGEVA